MTLWVNFDGYGEQVFCTFEEQFANLTTMNAEHYNLDKCSIEVVDNYDPTSGMDCVKDMGTGVVSMIHRPRGYQRVSPHKPAP